MRLGAQYCEFYFSPWLTASKWNEPTTQTDRDTGQRDIALGCDPQALEKKNLPCVLLLEIFALGCWLLTGGHGISLRVEYDEKQMVCLICALWLLVWSYLSYNGI